MILRSDAETSLGFAGAQPGAPEVNSAIGESPEVLTSSANQPSLVLAAKGAAQSGVTGPQTPEILQDRGRSPSADSVPSPDQRDRANFAPGMATPSRIVNFPLNAVLSLVKTSAILKDLAISHFRNEHSTISF